MDLVDRSSLVWYKLCVPGFVPKVKIAARNLARRQKALELVGRGLPITEVAREMCLSPYGVRKILHKALAAESLFPSGLDSEKVAMLRQVEGERLTGLWRRTQAALETIEARLGTDCERGLDGTAVARLIESGTRVCERVSRLFGLDAPTSTKVIEESMRLQVNVHPASDSDKAMLTWDRSILTNQVGAVAGLTMFEGCRQQKALEADLSDRTLPADALDVPEPESLPAVNVGVPAVNVAKLDSTNGDTAT